MVKIIWACSLPFGPVTSIFYSPKKIFSGQLKLALISGTAYLNNKFNINKIAIHSKGTKFNAHKYL